ncbi:molecular chaperone DnaJ [Nocardiopsis sp. YSL2]|nr:molecular chaperone DnaJ [Nocardiopsis sp. YSL2]
METYIINCVRCNGAGTIISEKRGLLLTRRQTCPECSGTGTGKKTITVDL